MTAKEMRKIEISYTICHDEYVRYGMEKTVKIMGFEFIKDEKSGQFKLVVMDQEEYDGTHNT